MIEILVLGAILVVVLVMLYIMVTEMANFVMTRVPFVPTKRVDIEDMVKRIGITETDYVFDIGSGNGKVVFIIEELTGARATGFQRAGWHQSFAKLRSWLTPSKAEFKSGNFFHHSWAGATVIYAYLYPFLMNQIAEKALADCRPGTKIIVRDFPIRSLQPKEAWKTPSDHEMFLYVI